MCEPAATIASCQARLLMAKPLPSVKAFNSFAQNGFAYHYNVK
jgi:hypothetical protein